MNIKRIFSLMQEMDLTISTAESCTGGMICSELTNEEGSSDYVIGSMVCYATRIKEAMLNVPIDTIETYGVVSGEVATELARNVKKIFKSSIGIGITGYIEKKVYYSIIIGGDYHMTFPLDMDKFDTRKQSKEFVVEQVINRLQCMLMNYKGIKVNKTIGKGL